eukprot:GFUD01114535.1.p1 GENE.GFUD01114535.1~~GFUD01114535.1.p1  ORF type:complete len:126 (-),score=25.37 GFUD01114535.1:182-559(-)
MTMVTDNMQFAKDIIDYARLYKIDHAVSEVEEDKHFQIKETSDALLQEDKFSKSNENFNFGRRTVLVLPSENEQLLDTINNDLHGKGGKAKLPKLFKECMVAMKTCFLSFVSLSSISDPLAISSH